MVVLSFTWTVDKRNTRFWFCSLYVPSHSHSCQNNKELLAISLYSIIPKMAYMSYMYGAYEPRVGIVFGPASLVVPLIFNLGTNVM